MPVINDYEVSSERVVHHEEIPYARLEDATPTFPTYPAAVLSLIPGTQLTGMLLSLDATDSIAVLDVTPGMVYKCQVRNVLTYAAAVEATWGPINVGDPIFYDRSPTMPAGVYLSTSPLDNVGAANPVWGHVVGWSDTDLASYPKGAALVASTQWCAVIMRGAASG